jgi:hypothetical protein
MRDSERYRAQADTVLRLAAKAASPAEKDVYLSIAEGWRRLAAEAERNEGHGDRRRRGGEDMIRAAE